MKIKLIPSFLLFSTLTMSLSQAQTQTNTRPNIILIESDDQRQDTINAFGNAFSPVITPALDAMVHNGMTLTNIRNQGSYNPAVCVASRAMLMGGCSLWHYKDNLEGRVTLGELLQKSGYYTYGTGKWHNGNASMMRSFTDADNITPGFLPKGHAADFPLLAFHNGQLIHGKNVSFVHATDLVGNTGLKFLQNYQETKPFFLYIGFNEPHDPYTRIPDFEKFYRDSSGVSTVSAPPAFLATPLFDPGVLWIRDEKLLTVPRDPKALADQNAVYLAMITKIDGVVARVFKTLKERGLDKNTIVIYTTDHGLSRGSHGFLGKQNIYEEVLKIPFIAEGPNIPAGKSNDSLLYNYEVYKTIADFANAMPPKNTEGTSFRDILQGGTTPHHECTYHGYTSLMRALVNDKWKLIEYNNKGHRHTQLFDLANDPHETKNLAIDPSQKGRINQLRQIMIQQRDKYGDHDTKFWNGIGFGAPLNLSPKAAYKHTQQQEPS